MGEMGVLERRRESLEGTWGEEEEKEWVVVGLGVGGWVGGWVEDWELGVWVGGWVGGYKTTRRRRVGGWVGGWVTYLKLWSLYLSSSSRKVRRRRLVSFLSASPLARSMRERVRSREEAFWVSWRGEVGGWVVELYIK